MAQGRVIVQILVAQRNPEYPLAQQIRHAMAQLAPLTRIAKPARHRRRQAKPAIRLTQQQRTAIARHLTAVETRLDPAPATGWKKKADQRYNPSPPRSRVRFCLNQLNHNIKRNAAVPTS